MEKIMRIWNINTGYLSEEDLFNEYKNLQQILARPERIKNEYSKTPKIKTDSDSFKALKILYKATKIEIELRKYKTKALLSKNYDIPNLPTFKIPNTSTQFKILIKKYDSNELGRIPLPTSMQKLWAQHKYSVMARNIPLYKSIGQMLAKNTPDYTFDNLATLLTKTLQTKPSEGGLRNALQHMWGYVSKHSQKTESSISNSEMHQKTLSELLSEIQNRVYQSKQPYLWHSTALSELQLFT